MHDLVLEQLDGLFAGRVRPEVVVVETQADPGVIDLLAVTFDDDALAHRIKGGLGPVTLPLRVRVLDALSRPRPIRLETLARRVGSSPLALTRSTLRPLEELGAIEVAGGRVRPTEGWRPVARRLTAIELKLSKWQEALRQADNAAFGVDAAWAVLDAARSRAAVGQVDHFRLYGVGLATISTEGELCIVTRPRRRRRVRWVRAWLGETAWAASERATERDARTGAFVTGSLRLNVRGARDAPPLAAAP
jgi:hypothetical protein